MARPSVPPTAPHSAVSIVPSTHSPSETQPHKAGTELKKCPILSNKVSVSLA